MKEKHVESRIRSIVDELPQSERKIAQFILDNPSSTIGMTANNLAKESGTSPASVIRFCKSIGIPSFTELKIRLSAEIDSPSYTSYSDITPDEPINEIKNKLLGNAYQSMKETLNILSVSDIEKFVEAIDDSDIIYVFGLGASYLVAENIAQKWNRIGKTCVCIADPHLLISILSSSTKNSVFIGISNSGETKEVLSLVKVAQMNDVKTISLTQFGSNSLSSKVDISIQTVKSKEAELRSAATSSLLSQFMAVDVLFYSYVSKNYDANIEQIRHSRSLVDAYKNS